MDCEVGEGHEEGGISFRSGNVEHLLEVACRVRRRLC